MLAVTATVTGSSRSGRCDPKCTKSRVLELDSRRQPKTETANGVAPPSGTEIGEVGQSPLLVLPSLVKDLAYLQSKLLQREWFADERQVL